MFRQHTCLVAVRTHRSVITTNDRFFWYGESYNIEDDSEQDYTKVYNTLKEIGVSQMWSGFIPKHMVELQDSYYRSIESNKNGKV